jgi:putative transcriptional regulator
MTTQPSFHLPESMLAEYVRGTGGEAEALVAACHVTLCGACQRRMALLEQGAVAELDHGVPVAVGGEVMDAVLARLEDPLAGEIPPLPVRSAVQPGLPRPLLRYLPAGQLPWRRVVPGIRTLDLPVRKAGGVRQAKVRLVSLHPGIIIPHHDHGGPEYTVVFSGGLRDHQGTCHRGDVTVRNPGDRHRQRVEAGSQCVALVVNNGDLLPTTWLGRLVKRLARE